MYRTRLALRLSGLLVLLLASILGFSGIAGASNNTPAPASKDGIVSSSNDGVSTGATHIWTAEEMLSAKPYPAPQIMDVKAAKLDHKANGPAGSVAGQQPKGGTVAAPSDISIMAFQVPDGSYSSWPYSAVGKLFFTQNGVNYQCSASMIKGHGIWTAGHCAHAGNNSPSSWSTNVVFIPQYNNGSAPLGQCSAYQLWTTSDWYTNGNPNGLDHDYAGGAVSCNVSGSTGWFGLAWNYGYGQTWTALGYPAAPPFPGTKMYGCTSALSAYGFGSPTTFGIWCDMTGGSSGGPWIISNAYVNANTSYGDSGHPGMLFSPYYDAGVKSLWDLLPN